MKTINVTVWSEYPHGQSRDDHKKAYPNGLHEVIKDFLEKNKGLNVKVALFDEPSIGLSDEVLDNTDVLIWWAHVRHGQVTDEIVAKIKNKVLCGMGLILLHSAHFSKVFSAVIGTSGRLNWREASEKQRIWTTCPSHPIAKGIPETFVLEEEEMYGEYFDIPRPDDVVFMGWFEGGNVLRSGVTFTRGAGKVFYFQPGHETHKTFYNKHIQKIITNAVFWAAPDFWFKDISATHEKLPYEIIKEK